MKIALHPVGGRDVDLGLGTGQGVACTETGDAEGGIEIWRIGENEELTLRQSFYANVKELNPGKQ